MIRQVEEHVRAFGKPEVTSIAEDTHVFHFERDGDWRNSELLLVNRNGHHFRLMKQNDGRWLFVKTWNKLLEWQDWMVEANLRRENPEELIALCGVGPQGRQSFEALSLLPREAIQGRRKAVWRHHMLDVRFNIDADTFTLIAPDMQSTFSGKLWESKDAARWCAANLSPTLVAKATALNPAVAERELLELEGSDLWGMF